MAGLRDEAMPTVRNIAPVPALSGQFTHYLENHSLPVQHAEVRQGAEKDVVVTLVSHLPSDGIWFDAIDDLIISVVMKSDHSPVTRDVGLGPQNFMERPGCILITPPKTSSYWNFSGNPLVLHLSIPCRHFRDLTGIDGPELQALLIEAARFPIYDQLLSQLTSRMWASLETRTDNMPAFGFHALGTILSLVLQNAADARHARLTAPCAPAQPLAPWRLRRAMNYMSERIDERPMLSELANFVELSPDHFSRCFTATTGLTPHQWQTNLRIEEAKRQLRDTNASMTEIAHSLGFSSSAHFSTRFRQKVGLSPREWRSGFTED